MSEAGLETITLPDFPEFVRLHFMTFEAQR